MKHRSAALVPALLLALLASAQSLAATDELAGVLRNHLSAESSAASSVALDWPTLRKFYAANDYHPVWFQADELAPRAQQLLQALRNADAEGLEPEAYHLSAIEAQWGGGSLPDQARLEMLLTDALARYGVQLQSGRMEPEAFDPNWYIETPPPDALAMLRQLLGADDIAAALAALAPSNIGYQRLRAALAQYRQLKTAGGWPTLPAGPLLKSGDEHEQLPMLRARLTVSGDLFDAQRGNPLLFDDVTEYAIRHFQRRHGIKEDGVVGPETRAVMNVPVDQRIEEIKLNMERWRWLPREFGERYVLVNTAGYELVVMEGDVAVLTMRVIVGKPERPTPTLNGIMNTLVFNPSWTLPNTVVVEDMIPRQLADPGYLKSLNIRVFGGPTEDARELNSAEIDWRQVSKDYLPYRLVQAPGPGNSLGSIKFKFSNEFEVFLHDTPSRGLFGKPSRALSSGCIRVEQPIALANYLLRGEQGWINEKIQKVITSGKTIEVNLPEPVPIYLVYFTVWVDANGEVNFVNDVYDLDQALAFCR